MNGVIGKTPKTPTVHTAYILNRVDAPTKQFINRSRDSPSVPQGLKSHTRTEATSSPQLPQSNQGELLGSQLAVVVAWEKTVNNPTTRVPVRTEQGEPHSSFFQIYPVQGKDTASTQ